MRVNKPLNLDGTLYVTGSVAIINSQNITGAGTIVADKNIFLKVTNCTVCTNTDSLFLYCPTGNIEWNNCSNDSFQNVIDLNVSSEQPLDTVLPDPVNNNVTKF